MINVIQLQRENFLNDAAIIAIWVHGRIWADSDRSVKIRNHNDKRDTTAQLQSTYHHNNKIQPLDILQM